MWLVTKIAVDPRDHERFVLHLLHEKGETMSITIDQNVLVEFCLKKGTELDEFTFEEIVYADAVKKAYHAALLFLASRMRSEKEIVDHLKKKGNTDAVIRDVLHELRKHRYVDDREFALAFVRTQINTTLKGPIVIAKELENLGIAEALIEESMRLFSAEKQREAAKKVVEKAKKQSKKRSSLEWKQQLIQLLQRKGFPRAVIDDVLSEMDGWQGEEEEWEALEYHARKIHRRYTNYSGWEYERKMKQALYRKGFSLEQIDRVLQMLKEE
ncbi:recombination regulator RecX [Anoxybacteroides amylolyticum]|uniref:Regulatory protein RecX n=1 Tax=Anoxybacteroides amylolyticum TaxID=294699 RepID=A0A160F0V2_9BACL|nr:recombination regulator RecX [Anoxybacillus amylolyticus]ANB59182.1 recX family protein [Anoxybacillus amylolyticus]